MTQYSYSVAIRTLGKAGMMYQKELASIMSQTIQPDNIFVYIPYGYDLPKETIGIEQYIRCQKGMVAQRALPFDKITSEYILFLDDDVYLEPDTVEKFFKALEEFNADAISADVFLNYQASWIQKIKYITGGTFPHFSKKWAFKIRRSSHYSYNNNPKRGVYLSQSSAGPISMIKKSAFKAIHFEDELWMDPFGYAQGDDQLMFYKLHTYGYRFLVHYNSGAVHLDAGSGHIKNAKSKHLVYQVLRYVMWYRSLYDIRQPWYDKVLNWYAYYTSILMTMPLSIYYVLTTRELWHVTQVFKGISRAKKFIKSEEYQRVPKFDAHKS